MSPPDLLRRISAPSPNHRYPTHSPPPPSPLSQSTPPPLSRPLQALHSPHPDRLSILDKRWPALFSAAEANVPPETSTNPPPSQGPPTQDPLDSDKLVYPATEAHSRSVSPEPEPMTRIRDCIASCDSTAVQQSKISNSIVSLEQDLQNIADQSSLDLDKARRGEAFAQNLLSTAKQAVDLAQENVSAALAAKDRADQALTRLAQLRSQYKNETCTTAGQQALKHNLEGSYQVISRRAKDKVSAPPTGLSRDALSAMAAEITRKTEPPHGSRKRKRCQDHDDPTADSDLPCQPSKEPRIRQHAFPSVGPSVESLADAVREAWNQEADRRSVIPPDAVALTIPDQQEQKLKAESHPSDTHQIKEDVPMQSAQGWATQASGLPGALSPEQDLLPGRPSEAKQDAGFVEETEDSLQAQRRRELEEQKREITKFQMRERELQESQAQRKDTENKKVVMLGDSNNGSIPPAVHGTSRSAPDEGHNAVQRKTGVSDNLKKVEQRLAMEKQQASMAKRSEPAEITSITQPPSSQGLIQKSTASERHQQTQDSLHPLRDVERGEEQKIRDDVEERKRKMSMNTATKTPVERIKFKEQSNDGVNKQNQPIVIMAPNVGNIVAQQTVTGSPVKTRGKKSCSPRAPVITIGRSSAQVSSSTSPAQGTTLSPRSSFRVPFIPLQPLNRENAPRNARRQNSVPPIECIVESSDDPVPAPKNAATSSPPAQAHNTSLPTVTLGTSVSQEAQSANPTFIPNSTEQKATLSPVSINDVVPKMEILSPKITNPPTIQYPLPQKPSNTDVHSAFTTPQQNTPKGIPLHPVSAVTTKPHDSLSQLRDENAGHHGTAATTNFGSNASPLTSSFPPRVHVDTSRQSDSPPPPLFVAEQPNIASSSHAYRSDARPSRGWSYGFSTRGTKRPRYERRWSPSRDRDHRIPRDHTYIPRTPSGSPPVASRESSPTYSYPPLSNRIEGALQNAYHPYDIADRYDRNTGSYDAPQVTSRRALVDRFSNTMADQSNIRGPQSLGRPRQGRGGLRLEERIT